MENGLLYSLFLHRAIGLTASKDPEIKMCQSDSFLSLVYDISTGRNKCGALFIFTSVQYLGVSKPSFLKAFLPPCAQEMLSLIIPEKSFLNTGSSLGNIYFPLPSEKMHFIAVISGVSKDEVPGRLLHKPIKINLLVMFSWIDPEQLLFVLRWN